jgi:predicted transcriptional regulator
MQSGRLPGSLGQPLNLLGINQATVSKMERRADMYISTLRSMIRAMRGRLKIEAVFPEGKVEISQFRKLKKTSGADCESNSGAELVVPTFTKS